MVLFMARPTTRFGSTNGQFKKRVPSDVLAVARGTEIIFSLPKAQAGEERIPVRAKVGTHVEFSLRTSDASLVTLRHAAALEQFERACAAYREGPRALTNKQRISLARILYDDLNVLFEDEPVDADWWRIVSEATSDALTGAPWPPPTTDISAEDRRQAALERYVGPFVNPILSREGVIPSDEDRPLLLRAFAKGLIDAASKLKRNAEGDYTPDDAVAARYPKWQGLRAKTLPPPSALTFDDLLMRWEKEGDKASSSLVSFRQHVAAFKAHLNHNDARRATKADVIAWKDALLDKKLAAKTINGSYLASIRTLYRLAKRNDLIATDPTEDVRVYHKRKAGTGRLVYSDADVGAILSLANAETDPQLHWIPWLLALTGARVGELAQLWGKHVHEIDGIHVINITPTDDGGTVKTASSERTVPIHPALIDRGFLAFVKTRPNGGPLFYGGKNATPRHRKSKTASHASAGTVNRVREWIRLKGFTNPRIAPSHSFRHWFKTRCTKLGIDPDITRAIQGHEGEGADAAYQHIDQDIAALYEAICKFSVPTLKRDYQFAPQSGGDE
jgi:integrase